MRLIALSCASIDREQGLLEMVRAAAADRSTALTAEQIDQAAARFLAAHPQVDPDGVQWQAQRAMMQRIRRGEPSRAS